MAVFSVSSRVFGHRLGGWLNKKGQWKRLGMGLRGVCRDLRGGRCQCGSSVGSFSESMEEEVRLLVCSTIFGFRSFLIRSGGIKMGGRRLLSSATRSQLPCRLIILLAIKGGKVKYDVGY